MSTLAGHTPQDERLPTATVMEARRGAEDYWFVFQTAENLEAVISFDTVAFDYRSDAPNTIRTINFLRSHHRRPDVKCGQVEGGRQFWGDDVVDALLEIREEPIQ